MRVDGSATVPDSVAVRGGTASAALGVLGFSFTFPATAWALEGFGPWTSAALRCGLAALLAAAFLRASRAPLPTRRQLPGLAVVALGCVLGFPLLSTLALETTSTGNAAVVIGALPIATAALASVRTGRRHSPLFWGAAAAGAAAVAGFTLLRTGGAPGLGDLYLFGALVVCAAGYAEGGRLAGEMPGAHVISWGLVLSLPVMAPLAAAGLAAEPVHPTGTALAGLAYLVAISQFGAFVLWYRGMGLIGVGRASQLQLAQPLLTLVWAVLLLGEELTPAAPAAAAVVLACIAVTQRAK